MTLDANIIILYLNGDQEVITAIKSWRETSTPLFLSSVAESEILSFPQYTSKELAEVMLFLEQNFTPVPFDRTIARISAEIRRTTKIKFPDVAIAATAFYTNTAIVTRNQRDFKRIENNRIVVI